jgi:hypothetical protein
MQKIGFLRTRKEEVKCEQAEEKLKLKKFYKKLDLHFAWNIYFQTIKAQMEDLFVLTL